MIIGRVIGSLVATQKDPSLVGKKLLIVKSIDLEGNLQEPFLIAVDIIGAGIGETVLIVNGSSARMSEETRDRSIDSVIIAKVDSIQTEEKEVSFK